MCITVHKQLTKILFSTLALKLDANEALFQLQEVRFPADSWNSLANGLKLGGQVNQFEGCTNSSKLQQLITYWISNNEQASWQQLVDAVKGCGQLVRAKQLAENVRALPSTSTGECNHSVNLENISLLVNFVLLVQYEIKHTNFFTL